MFCKKLDKSRSFQKNKCIYLYPYCSSIIYNGGYTIEVSYCCSVYKLKLYPFIHSFVHSFIYLFCFYVFIYFYLFLVSSVVYMEIDTRHGIHITEKAGSHHMSSENWQIDLKACQTLKLVKCVSLYLELISGRCGDRTSIIVTVALCANHYSTRAEIFDKFCYSVVFLRYILFHFVRTVGNHVTKIILGFLNF